MRRLLIVLAVAGFIVAVAVVATRRSSDHYRVAAEFDTAKGMVPGQQVKIAGAVVGKVESVELAPGPKARLILAVDRRFAPFRQDATCKILPEGLISENFVACDPGSPNGLVLQASAGLPTVPVTQTAVPTTLDDVMEVFALPTADRLRVLISELGIATAGRGEDLNALLRRTNPALEQASRLLGLVNRQRASLSAAVAQTDRVVGALAHRDDDVRRFVDRAAVVASTAAVRSDALGEAVRRLPPLLETSRPALRSIDRVVDQGTPLLRALRESAPALSRVTRDLPPFAAAAQATLTRLVPVADSGRRTVDAALPVVGHLHSAMTEGLPAMRQLDALLVDSRDRGGIEGVMRWLYSFATATSAYDETSHIAGFVLRTAPQCFASASTPGCDVDFNAPGQGTIPPDNPSCGPQNGAPWDPPTTCTSEVPTRRRAAHQPAPQAKGLVRVLDYLLGP